MAICIFIYAIPALTMNSAGDACLQNESYCLLDNLVDFWSIDNVGDDENILLVQQVLWLVITVLIIPFNLYLRVYTKQLYNEIDQENITESDYSIILRRLPENTTKEDIGEFIQQHKFSLSKQQLDTSDNMAIIDIILLHNSKEFKQAQYEEVQRFKEYIKKNQVRKFHPIPMPRCKEFSGIAIVIFNSPYAKYNFQDTIPYSEKFISYFCPFYRPTGKFQINGSRINIQPAPQPTNIIWSHFGHSEANKIKRKILYLSLTILVLIGSGFIYWGLEKAYIEIEQQGGNAIVFLIFKNLFLILFNLVISQILYVSTRKQKLDNYTDEHVQLFQKQSFYLTINYGFFLLLVPLLARLPDIEIGITSLRLTLTVLITITFDVVGQSFIDLFIKYCQLEKSVLKFLISCRIILKTQSEANRQFQGVQIKVVGHYVFILRSYLYSLVFSIISPICLIIGFIGLTMAYFIQKYLFAKRYSIPNYEGYRINEEFIDLLDVSPLFIGCFNLIIRLALQLSFQLQELPLLHRILIFINIGIGVVNFIVPWQTIVQNFYREDRTKVRKTFDDVDETFEVRYSDLDPSNEENVKNEKIVETRWLKKFIPPVIKSERIDSEISSERNLVSNILKSQSKKCHKYKRNDHSSPPKN